MRQSRHTAAASSRITRLLPVATISRSKQPRRVSLVLLVVHCYFYSLVSCVSEAFVFPATGARGSCRTPGQITRCPPPHLGKTMERLTSGKHRGTAGPYRSPLRFKKKDSDHDRWGR
ncbi:hypothetical protein Naga_101559g2, partial [Nannochloropsis gaditana]